MYIRFDIKREALIERPELDVPREWCREMKRTAILICDRIEFQLKKSNKTKMYIYTDQRSMQKDLLSINIYASNA